MNNTPNIDLELTPEITNESFKAWRTKMNGETNSNMIKIDSAFGEYSDKLADMHRPAAIIVGTSLSGHTAEDVDFLCDGEDDDVEIQAAISTLMETGGEVLIREGEYNIGQLISVSQNIALRGIGAESTVIKRAFAGDDILSIDSNTRLNGFTLDNANMSGNLIHLNGANCIIDALSLVNGRENSIGIAFGKVGTNNISVFGCKFKDVAQPTGVGFPIIQSEFALCNGFIFTNNSVLFYNIPSSDLSIYSETAIISDNIFYSTTLSLNSRAIDLNARCNGVIIKNNRVTNFAFAFAMNREVILPPYHGSPPKTLLTKRCVIEGNILYNSGIARVFGNNHAITGNISTASQLWDVWPPSIDVIGIYLDEGGDNIIADNTICSFTSIGINVAENSTGNVIRDNHVAKAGGEEDYSEEQFTIRVKGNNNSVFGNVISGKNYVDEGADNSFYGNRYQDADTFDISGFLGTNADKKISELPAASEAYRGKIITLYDDLGGDSMYICRYNGAEYEWVEITPVRYKSFGVAIDLSNSNPESAVTYTDDAVGMSGGSSDWDSLPIFRDIRPCVLKNGVVQYYLDKNDFAKKEDGTAADITSGNDGDVMIEIPKIGYSVSTTGDILTVKITDDPNNADFRYYAHTRENEGDRDKLYIGAYLGYNNGGKLSSLSGKTPTATQTIETFRDQAQANGAGYDIVSFYPHTLLQCLYLIRYKHLNSQSAIGRGYVDGNSSTAVTGGTNAEGMNHGEITGKLQMKFLGIEDFWGNLRCCLDGLYSDSSRNILTAFQDFNNSGAGYTNHGRGAVVNISGYMSKPQGTSETGFITKENTGSASTYFADMGYLSAAALAYSGGNRADGDTVGAFYLRIDLGASGTSSTIGSRLMYL